jgi:hypothetical protein
MFVREWSKATIKMDCNTWTPSFTFKSDDSESAGLMSRGWRQQIRSDT